MAAAHPTKAPVGSLKFYTSTIAFHPGKVAIMLAETGLPHTTVKLDLLAGATLEPWFVKLNPAGSLPVIEHNGKVITESLVIWRYLDGLLETPLGGDQVDREFINEFAQVIDTFDGNLWFFAHVPPPVLDTLLRLDAYRKKRALAHARRNPQLKAVYDAKVAAMSSSYEAAAVPEKVAECEAILTRLLDEAESRLSAAPEPDTAFLAGSAYSLADAIFAPILLKVSGLAHDQLNTRPALAAYSARAQARPSWAAAFAEGSSPAGQRRAFGPAVLRSKISALLNWY